MCYAKWKERVFCTIWNGVICTAFSLSFVTIIVNSPSSYSRCLFPSKSTWRFILSNQVSVSWLDCDYWSLQCAFLLYDLAVVLSLIVNIYKKQWALSYFCPLASYWHVCVCRLCVCVANVFEWKLFFKSLILHLSGLFKGVAKCLLVELICKSCCSHAWLLFVIYKQCLLVRAGSSTPWSNHPC